MEISASGPGRERKEPIPSFLLPQRLCCGRALGYEKKTLLVAHRVGRGGGRAEIHWWGRLLRTARLRFEERLDILVHLLLILLDDPEGVSFGLQDLHGKPQLAKMASPVTTVPRKSMTLKSLGALFGSLP